MLDQYHAQKSKLLAVMERARLLAERRANSAAASLIAASAERLSREQFTLVVLGEFKRGKSTLINALLGCPLLPSAIVPLTAIPTVISYGPSEEVRVIFLDGTEKKIEIGEIASYVTEKENPKNEKGVQEVHINYPSDFLAKGVMLVDTPGIGSIYQHNTDAAYGYLPHADAALFVTSVDAPLSKSELEYLKDIAGHAKKIFFVLNKADNALPQEVAEAVEFTAAALTGVLGFGRPYVIPVSARLALLSRTGEADGGLLEKSGIINLEKTLGGFIESEKGKLLIEACASKVQRVLSELELELKLLERAMDSTVEELESKITALNTELSKLEEEREDSIYLLYREVERLGRYIEERMQEYYSAHAPRLLAELEDYYRQEAAGRPAKEVAGMLSEFTREIIQLALNEKRQEETLAIKKEMEQISAKFFSRIEEIVDRMMAASATAFELKIEKTAAREYILDTKKFFFHFAEHPTFIPSFETLAATGLIPGFLAKGVLLKNSKNKLTELFDRNCGRLRYELAEGIKEGAREVAGELRLRSDAVLNGIKATLAKALEEKKLSEAERLEKRKGWEEEMEEIKEIQKTLAAALLN